MPFYRGMTCENHTINGHQGTPRSVHLAHAPLSRCLRGGGVRQPASGRGRG
ncbi:MAG: hypothetical protein K0R61_1526 [Microvirga sp.]|jgi:hypothetical protein|nr:hypothetical protein [Microvirga sp.]